VRGKAEQFGVKEIYIDDLREEFVRDYVFPMFRCASCRPSQHSRVVTITAPSSVAERYAVGTAVFELQRLYSLVYNACCAA